MKRNINDIQAIPLNHNNGDYIYVPVMSEHSIYFEEDSLCMCIGIALDWKE